jgi:hypothetical protein
MRPVLSTVSGLVSDMAQANELDGLTRVQMLGRTKVFRSFGAKELDFVVCVLC